MNRDFSLNVYKELLLAVKNSGYEMTSFEDFIIHKYESQRILILRHDVDKRPTNALSTAWLENQVGVKCTYYFRIVSESFNPDIIKQIITLGHEIGYHYEDLALSKGNYERALESFELNLNKFRQFYPVSTICMHGSPISRWNNLDLWDKYNYRSYGIIGEPNIDINFNEFFYLTDTGMAWNLDKYAIRDLPKGFFNFDIKSTADIIAHLNKNILPEKLMINTHPQRWSDSHFEWFWELVTQSLKNQFKRIVKNKYSRI